MNKLMTADAFIEQLKLAVESKTIYATGGWGACAGIDDNRQRYAKRCSFNKEDILNASDDTFYFDCVCLIKGILWGWNADTTAKYGGATYASNGVGDYSISTITKMCDTYSNDFFNIEKGEWVNIGNEHCGIYIGDGKVIESTPIWADGVQITNLQNIGYYGFPSRMWNGHGKLPWVEYTPTYLNVLAEDGWWGKNTTYYTQKMLGLYPTNLITLQPTSNRQYVPNAVTTSWSFTKKPYGGDTTIKAIQQILSDMLYYTDNIDGWCGKNTVTALQKYLHTKCYYFDKIDGYMGYYTVCAWQEYVNDYFHNLVD